MDIELNKQVRKLKIQAKKAGIKLKLEINDNLIMVYPNHRKDICGSIGYADKSNIFLVSYVINLKKMEWATMEGFDKEQIRTDEKLNSMILKEVRPDVLINFLV